jgi:cellulose synthase/poly-beta-1,6-N-acetylglucosamine synthase-like glycosyltransferase
LVNVIFYISIAITAAIVLIGLPQILYTFVGLAKPKTYPEAKIKYKYACVICARNERKVIAQLIESIKKQDYPSELVDIFVVADNCTDDTAVIAREAGAIVYERFNPAQYGKCYALQFIFDIIHDRYADKNYKGYFFFDADNLLSRNYITEMNKAVNAGELIINSHRAPKNYDNWISAGTGLMFLQQTRLVHYSRARLNTSTYIAGTGFYVDAEIIKKQGGWPYHSLTEDVEFSHAKVLEGYKITYCDSAVFYDDQAFTIRDTINQRARWIKGGYQCCSKFWLKHVKNISRSFASYDLLILLLPIPIVSFSWAVISNLAFLLMGIFNLGININQALIIMGLQFAFVYIGAWLLGVYVTILEWKYIKVSAIKKILYTFTFPLNLMLFFPSVYIALGDVKWRTIQRTEKSIADLETQEQAVNEI